MADHVGMSLDDYIKTQKKKGKPFVRGGGGGRGGGSGRRGPKANRGGGNAAASYGNGGNRDQNSFRGRKGRPSFNNVQRRRGGFNGNRNRQQLAGNGSNFPRGNRLGGGQRQQQAQGSNRNRRNRNVNRQARRPRNSGLQQRGQGQQQAVGNFRYFKRNLNGVGGGRAVLALSGGVQTPRRNQNQVRRLRLKKSANVGVMQSRIPALMSINSNRSFLKLAKKRVQRAKMLVSRKKAAAKIPTAVGRVALSKNGFVTIRNTNAKRMERQLVQMKIARAQQARNRLSMTPTQRPVNLPGPSGSGGRRRNRGIRRVVNNNTPVQSRDWNTSIVRTMTNDLVDDMVSGQLNPDIQRKIAFIQSRAKGDRAPVMPDFRAPVSTSRMTLGDRFRLLNDQ